MSRLGESRTCAYKIPILLMELIHQKMVFGIEAVGNVPKFRHLGEWRTRELTQSMEHGPVDDDAREET